MEGRGREGGERKKVREGKVKERGKEEGGCEGMKRKPVRRG